MDHETSQKITQVPTKHNSNWTNFVSHRWHQQNWVPQPESSSQPSISVENLTVVTQNVLFDEFEADKLHSTYRWASLLKELAILEADIIGFQEVTPTFLSVLINTDWVKQGYYVSNVNASHCTPYGQVMISKHPFTGLYFEYSSHKRVIISTFIFNSRKVHVPVVHLTSDHGKGNLAAKRQSQMEAVYSKIIASDIDKDDGTDCIIIGDFNMGDGGEGEAVSIRPELQDCWKCLNGEDPGYTFDPLLNDLALLTSKTGIRRRYDRILVRSTAFHWFPQMCNLVHTSKVEVTIGDGSTLMMHPSDHFGLLALIHFNDDQDARLKKKAERAEEMEASRSLAANISSFLVAQNMIETKNQVVKRTETVQILQNYIRTVLQTDNFKLYQVGSFGLGLQSPTSDLDILCCGTMQCGEFLTALTQLFRNEARINPHVVTARPRLVFDAVVPIITTSINNIPLDIQYACIPNATFNTKSFDLYKLMSDAETHPEIARQLGQSSMLAGQSYSAVQILASIIPNTNTFQHAYQCIRRWAAAKGMTSNRMGFVGGHGWTIMLTRVAQLNPRASAFELVSAFFSTYAAWDFRKDPVTVITRPAIGYSHVSKKEPLVIVTCTAPYKNITRNATHSSRRILIAEFQKANSIFVLGGNPIQILEQLWQPTDFFTLHSSFLKVCFSAGTRHDYEQLAGQIESRLVQLLLLLESTPMVLAHPWPIRFVNVPMPFQYSGALYIGLSPIKENIGSRDLQKDGGHLDLSKYVQEFESLMHRWAGWNPETMNMAVKQKSKASLEKKPTQETSSTYPTADSDDEDEEEEEEEATEVDETPAPAPQQPSSSNSLQSQQPSSSNKNQTKQGNDKSKKDKGKGKHKQSAQDPEKKARFRHSEEVMNWIRHDARFNPEEFTISYEDRFVGLMEVEFTSFTRDQSSDVFIPMHRVWLIKHRGVVVWDRKARVDNVDSLLH